MSIPKAMQEKYDSIAPIITEFCSEYLNDEYAEVSLRMLEKLCRKRPSPLLSGKPNTWACGIVYAVGSTNFLFDKSQTPHMRAAKLAELFYLSPSSAGNKAGEIRKIFNISVFDPEWTLPSRIGDNPLVWMYETRSGFIFDARYAPREVQEELYYAGMIPFIPADRETSESLQEKAQDYAQGEVKAEAVSIDNAKKKKESIPLDGQITLFNKSDDDKAE